MAKKKTVRKLANTVKKAASKKRLVKTAKKVVAKRSASPQKTKRRSYAKATSLGLLTFSVLSLAGVAIYKRAKRSREEAERKAQSRDKMPRTPEPVDPSKGRSRGARKAAYARARPNKKIVSDRALQAANTHHHHAQVHRES